MNQSLTRKSRGVRKGSGSGLAQMNEEKRPLRILFVCHGNICRSPAAEAAFLHAIEMKGLQDRFVVDSAGTSSFHIGERPHPDTRRAAQERGIALNHHARQFREDDFERFDWILAMDTKNLHFLQNLARSPAHREKLALFRAFDPEKNRSGSAPDVPDPYYGGYSGFQEVQDIVTRTSEQLLSHLLNSPTAPHSDAR